MNWKSHIRTAWTSSSRTRQPLPAVPFLKGQRTRRTRMRGAGWANLPPTPGSSTCGRERAVVRSAGFQAPSSLSPPLAVGCVSRVARSLLPS